MTTVTFKLKCVICGDKETRQLSHHDEQPFCSKCYGPMIVDKVTVKHSRPTQAETEVSYRRDLQAIGDGRKLP
jgi:hypothetical protein